MAFLGFLPSSLASIPVKYLVPSTPDCQSTAAIISGDDAGLILDILDDVLPDGKLMGRTREPDGRIISVAPTNAVRIEIDNTE